MNQTIQKSSTGAYFTVTDSSGIVRWYGTNDYDLIPQGDSIHLSVIHKYSKADNRVIIDNQPYNNLINGDTSSAFADYATCVAYILANFFRNAGGSGSSYTLPVATSSVLGGVKQGSGVAIAGDGTLSVSGGSGLTAANNLSDVASMNTSRQNLGLQTVWNRKGTVIYPSTAADQQTCGEPTVILDTNPQILTSNTGNIFKMWFTQGWTNANICYAESPDGVSWTRYATAVVANRNRSFVLKNGSTYYMYAANLANTQIDRFTSSDGITWTLATSAVITAAGSGWTSGTFSPFVFIESGTWKMMLDGLVSSVYGEGYYTSSDGITWTQGATNPVVSYTAENPVIFKIGSTYYLYGHGNSITSILPCDIYRQSSTDLINWSAPVLVLSRQTVDEGAGLATAQISDISMLQVGNSVYLYYTSTPNGGAQSGIAHIKLAVANMTLAELVTTSEGTGGDIIVPQPNFVVNPSTNNLTYTGGDYSTFNINSPTYPSINLVSGGTTVVSLGGGASSIYTTANDISLKSQNAGNISIEATNIQLSGNTILNKTGSFGLTSSLSNGNWNFTTGGGFQFYFNYKGTVAQQTIFTNSGNAFTSPQSTNDLVLSNTTRMVFATSGTTQAAAYAAFDPSDKTFQLNGGNLSGFTSTGSRLQTTSISYALTSTPKTSNYTLGVDDNTVTGDTSGGTFIITLPTAVGIIGREYIIKKIDSSLTVLTVGTTSSQTIDGVTTYNILFQNSFIVVRSNGSNWYIVANSLQTLIVNGIGVTQTNAILLQNTSAAALGAQQVSPSIEFDGKGWQTTGSTSNTVGWRMQFLPIQGAATNTGSFNMDRNIGGVYANVGSITTDGNITFSGNASFGPTIINGTINISSGTVVVKTNPAAINSTATATVGQMAQAWINSTSAAPVTITTPTATALATQIGAVRGTYYDFTIDNTVGANTVTLAPGSGFTQLTGVSTSLTIPTGTTGIGTWRISFVSGIAATISRIQ